MIVLRMNKLEKDINRVTSHLLMCQVSQRDPTQDLSMISHHTHRCHTDTQTEAGNYEWKLTRQSGAEGRRQVRSAHKWSQQNFLLFSFNSCWREPPDQDEMRFRRDPTWLNG